MKTIMKKRILWLMAILSVLALLTAGTVLLVTAETPVPTVDVLGQNLVFENNIYIKYAVKIGGIENPENYSFGMLYWTDPQTSYEKGSEDLSETSTATETVAEELCYIFTYKKLAAKQMADDIYARAYIEVDGDIYYSDVQKYSILQYAYNKLGITGNDPSQNEDYKTLLRDMLQYGASAQIYFNYRTDRLANADFRQINVVGGTLPDGSNQGLYIIGEEVTLTAKETNADGIPFAYWKNSAGARVGMDLTYTATIGEENETYTAVYEETIAATPDEYFTFTLQSDDTYSIKAKDVNNMPAEVVLPSTYNGKAVTNIGNQAFCNCTSLTSITIPDSVTSIGYEVFYDCTSLTSITIPDSVTSIGHYAFEDCTSLTSITIPDSVTSIGDSAFRGCSGLASITVNSANTVYHSNGNCLIKTASKTLIAGCKNSIIPSDGSVTSIGHSAFEECTSLTSITIPNSVTSIGNYTFRNCTSLASISVGNGVTSIGDHAFHNCYRLVELYNCSSLDIQKGSSSNGYVGYYALNVYTPTIGESKLHTTDDGYVFCEDDTDCYLVAYQGSETDLTLPESYNGRSYKIYQYAFYYCDNLTSITIPDSVTSIGRSAFEGCTSLTSVNIGNNVTSIGISAFSDCTSLTSVTIPDSVTSIGWSAFDGCSGLTGSIIIPDGVTSVDSYVFRGCSGLTSITIPASVTSIGSYAFNGCTELTSITIPTNVTSIGGFAFEGCSGLTSITIPDSVKSIGENAFSGCTGIIEIENLVFYVDNWVIDYNGRVTNVTLRSNTVGISAYAFYGCGSLTSITIPDGVKSIGAWAFSQCSNLTNITIPDSVTSIGSAAFSLCSDLTSITIPDGVTSIGGSVFSNCTSLTSVNIGNNVKSIDSQAFSNCTSLTDITIPNSVTSIGAWAFSNCTSLTSITIPDSVTSIGNYAFDDCTSLTSITIPFVGNTKNGTSNTNFGYIFGGNNIDHVPASLKTVVITGGASINRSAFSNCSGIESITITASVTSIDWYAFMGCTNLKNVTIPASVTSIGHYAFGDCTNLSAVYYTGTASEWGEISIDSNSYLTSATRYYYSETEPTDMENLYWHYVDGIPTAW